ncbi:MAG: PGF-CTERM sorting domain-containing protein, partial [Candidatus Thermoplasmatota archaeon]|nr:PGF-CTERM sorting domain-containing protein [Candidatus Thermoplasmatota archaeon]
SYDDDGAVVYECEAWGMHAEYCAIMDSDICDEWGSTYDGAACGLEIAHWCADNPEDDSGGCQYVSDGCENEGIEEVFCAAYTAFDHDSHHDSDGDGVHDDADLCDGGDDLVDVDGDGVGDGVDVCQNTTAELPVNWDGCALYQLDSDGDGVMSDVDMCPMTHPSDVEYVDENGCAPPVEVVDPPTDDSDDSSDTSGDDASGDDSSDTSGDEEDDDDKGRLPGFTVVVTLTAMMGALLLAGRRKV